MECVHLPEDLKELDITKCRKQGERFHSLEDHEIDYIQCGLKETGGNKTMAANILGIDRVSLWRKIKRYALEPIGKPGKSAGTGKDQR